MSDLLQRFSFQGLPVRGAVARLNQTWLAVRHRNPVPMPAQELLGQALAASALLSSDLKIRARVGLQLQGEGPLKLLLAQCASDGGQRGIARCPAELSGSEDFSALTRASTLVISIDGTQTDQNYQGIVPLEGNTLAAALEGYFRRSEQLATGIWLVADHEKAAGLLIQRLPGHHEYPEAWEELCALAGTLTLEELLSLEALPLLGRLFPEHTILDGGSVPLEFACQCSRDKVVEVLRVLGRDALTDDLRQHREVTVDCEFCNERYGFDAVDIDHLFAGQAS